VPLDEILNAGRNVSQLQIAAPPQFPGDVLRHVTRLALELVEAEYPDRVFVLAIEQVENDGLKIGGLEFRFAPDPAEPAEIIHHQVDVMIVTAGGRSRASSWAYALPGNSNDTEPGFKPG